MSAEGVSDDLVQRIADDLRRRYSLDDEDVRAVGARLAEPAGARTAQNRDFADRFVHEHRETFNRLAE